MSYSPLPRSIYENGFCGPLMPQHFYKTTDFNLLQVIADLLTFRICFKCPSIPRKEKCFYKNGKRGVVSPIILSLRRQHNCLSLKTSLGCIRLCHKTIHMGVVCHVLPWHKEKHQYFIVFLQQRKSLSLGWMLGSYLESRSLLSRQWTNKATFCMCWLPTIQVISGRLASFSSPKIHLSVIGICWHLLIVSVSGSQHCLCLTYVEPKGQGR